MATFPYSPQKIAEDVVESGVANHLRFNPNPVVPAHAEGQMYWDETDKTMAINMAHVDVTLQVGQEQFVRVFNNTGVEIPNGSAVYISGTQGNRPTVALADATLEATQYVLGVITHTLDAAGDGRYGYCTVQGIVRGFDTRGMTEGLPLWLSETPGQLTQTRPDAPAHAVYVGIPLNSTENGSIFVNPKTGSELNELHDVSYPTTPADGELLMYDGVDGRWENKVVTPTDIGSDVLHGIESHGAITFNNTTHVLSVAGTTAYWFNGTRYETASAIECDLDLVADRDHASATLTANTLYFLYFKDATGKLYWSPAAWSIDTNKVPVATVFWNGSAGAVVEETHGYQRDLDWHRWAHLTVGARISASDFAITAPSSGSPSTVNFAGGTLYDEDHASTYVNNTPAGMLQNCRIWYQTGASAWTFVDSTSVYPAGGVSFVDSGAAYALRALTSGFGNCWVYASPDIDRPLYVFLETVNRNSTSGYTTAANARAINPPSIVGAPVQQELKLLYRIIMNSAEAFVEHTDYRASASLPAGGTTAPTAAAVTFTPSGNIAASSVQTAIEELDTEKSATSHTHTVTDRIVAVFDGGGSEIADAKKVYVYVPFTCTIVDWTAIADQSGSITVDVWKDTYANFPPTDDDSITGTGQEVKITSATKGQDLDVTNWDNNPQTITAGDVLCFNVDSCTTITWCQVVLTVTRTV